MKRLQQFLLAIALLMMLGHTLIYVAYSVALIQFPFDYDQGEGFELQDTILLSEGKSPYRDNETFPFYASNYPPVYHVVLIPFAWIFGAEYWYGRLLAFLGTLVTTWAIAYGVQRETHHRLAGLLAGLAFLASNYIYHIGPLFRQHLFMVMFETLAVVALANVFTLAPTQQRKRLWMGMALLLLAGYTKQLAYATVIATLVWLALRNPRRAIFYGAGLGGAAGVVFVLINLTTDGQWYTNVIAANVNEYLPYQFRGLLKQFLRLHWALLILAGLMVIYELYFSRISIYSAWFVFAGVNTTLAGKWGAGDSYFASFITAMCILAGIFLGKALQGDWQLSENYISRLFYRFKTDTIYRVPTGGLVGVFALGLFIIYGGTVIKMPTQGMFFDTLSDWFNVAPQPGHRYPFYDAAGWTEGYATIGHLPSQTDVDNGWRIVERIQASDKPVMSEEAGFSLQAERTVISNPTQLKNLYENDLYDPSALLKMIDRQEFGLLIFRAQFYPAPVMTAVFDAYEPVEVIPMNGFNYELWEPSPTWDERRLMKDYLETAPTDAEPFTLTIPAEDGVTDMQAWLTRFLGFWAWEPLTEPLEHSGDCSYYGFQRVAEQVVITVCEGNQLTVQKQ